MRAIYPTASCTNSQPKSLQWQGRSTFCLAILQLELQYWLYSLFGETRIRTSKPAKCVIWQSCNQAYDERQSVHSPFTKWHFCRSVYVHMEEYARTIKYHKRFSGASRDASKVIVCLRFLAFCLFNHNGTQIYTCITIPNYNCRTGTLAFI